MLNITEWIDLYKETMQAEFGSRICFMGLQGSYARQEATEQSDIDMVLILDKMNFTDLQTYKNLLQTLPNPDLICGFVSGREELTNWNLTELFQFYYDTMPIIGSLDDLIPEISAETIRQYVKNQACTIYHTCCHNFVHKSDVGVLQDLYKAAFFVLQAKYFLKKQVYCENQNQLVRTVKNGKDKSLLITIMHRDAITESNFEEMSQNLMEWSADLIDNF